MSATIQDELSVALQTAAFDKQSAVLAAHLSEIEAEAESLLDILTTLRAFARHEDAGAIQEALAELAIGLEHLVSHAKTALPVLQQGLDIQPE